jgi:hypothetical protein
MTTLNAFTKTEYQLAKRLLAGKVASMQGRKFEEGDWSDVYCAAKNIPDTGWSNLHIDVSYAGKGIEFKMLRISQLGNKPIKSVCGTTLMHPAATRSIRIEDTDASAQDVMEEVFRQYADLISARAQTVQEGGPGLAADMRFGWLIWEDSLTEFLYFEEKMVAPNAANYYATWNETAAKGIRKPSKSLWIYDKKTNQKRYSVTTSAGIKIQPYFDVPAPADPELVYFRVQSEPIDKDTIILWVSELTASLLEKELGSIKKGVVSDAITAVIEQGIKPEDIQVEQLTAGVPLQISREAFNAITSWNAKSDEQRIQLLLQALESVKPSRN